MSALRARRSGRLAGCPASGGRLPVRPGQRTKDPGEAGRTSTFRSRHLGGGVGGQSAGGCFEAPSLAGPAQARDSSATAGELVYQHRPQFAAKAADIVGLYLDPPKNAVVLSVEEKPHIQALERAQGYLKLPNGHAVTGFSHLYKRHGTITLFAALEVLTGQVRGGHAQRRRRRDFLAFLNEVVAWYPGKELHVVLDNLNIHKPKHDRWRTRHPNVHLHFTPTHANWLNQIECWFSILSWGALRGASFSSLQEVREAIDRSIAACNPQAAPSNGRSARFGTCTPNDITHIYATKYKLGRQGFHGSTFQGPACPPPKLHRTEFQKFGSELLIESYSVWRSIFTDRNYCGAQGAGNWASGLSQQLRYLRTRPARNEPLYFPSGWYGGLSPHPCDRQRSDRRGEPCGRHRIQAAHQGDRQAAVQRIACGSRINDLNLERGAARTPSFWAVAA